MAALISKKDAEKIKAALKKASEKSSCSIRVHIRRELDGDLMKAAVEKFNELDLARAPERNAILIYIVKEERQLTILGDEGIHEKAGKDFWKKAVAAMVGKFKKGEFAAGVAAGVEKAAEAAGKLFPPEHEHVCEDCVTF